MAINRESGSLAGPGLALCLAVESEHNTTTQTHRINNPTQIRKQSNAMLRYTYKSRHKPHLSGHRDSSGCNADILLSAAISAEGSTQ